MVGGHNSAPSSGGIGGLGYLSLISLNIQMRQLFLCVWSPCSPGHLLVILLPMVFKERRHWSGQHKSLVYLVHIKHYGIISVGQKAWDWKILAQLWTYKAENQIPDLGEFITIRITACGFLMVSQPLPGNIPLHHQLLSCLAHLKGGNNKANGLWSRPLQSMWMRSPGVVQCPTCAAAHRGPVCSHQSKVQMPVPLLTYCRALGKSLTYLPWKEYIKKKYPPQKSELSGKWYVSLYPSTSHLVGNQNLWLFLFLERKKNKE